MSHSASSLSVQADCQGQAATFDLPRQQTATLESVWSALQEVFPVLHNRRGWRLEYVDEEGDEVQLSFDADVEDALAQAGRKSPAILELLVKPAEGQMLMQQSTLLDDGQWEDVNSQSSISPLVPSRTVTQESNSDAERKVAETVVAPVSVPDAAPVAAPVVEEVREAEPVTTPAPVAEVAVVAEVQQPEVTPVVTAVAESPAASPVPAASPGVFGSLFGLFGRGGAAAPTAPAPLQPALSPLSESTTLPAPSSLPASLSNSAVIKQSEREFWEMDDDGHDALIAAHGSLLDESGLPASSSSQSTPVPPASSAFSSQSSQGSQSNSFVQAMDARALRAHLFDSNVSTEHVLQQVMQAMLTRAEQQLGVDFVPNAAPAHASWIRPPSQSMLDALKEIDAAAFEPVVEAFTQVCVAHAAAREKRLKEEEERKVQALVEELAREEKSRAEAEARLAAEVAEREREQQRAQAEAQRVAQESAAASQRASLLAEQQATAELIERRVAAEREAAARAGAQPQQAPPAQPRLPSEPCYAPAPLLMQPQMAPAAGYPGNQALPRPAPQPSSIASSPVVVPLVHVPVASPLHEPALAAADRFNSAMSELRAMGFSDDALNTVLLQKNRMDINAVLDWLQTDQACGGELKAELMQNHQV